MAVSTWAGCSTGRLRNAAALHAHLGSAVAPQRATTPWQQCTARARRMTREQHRKGCLRQSFIERTLHCTAGWSLQPFTVRLALHHHALLCFPACFYETEQGLCCSGPSNACSHTELVRTNVSDVATKQATQEQGSMCLPVLAALLKSLPGLSASCRLQTCPSKGDVRVMCFHCHSSTFESHGLRA